MTKKTIRRRIGACAAAIAVIVATTPAFARDWPKTAGWDIFEGENFCGMALEYEGKGDTLLSVAKFTDSHALVVVTNYGWSAKKDEKYDLRFLVGSDEFGGGKSIGIGENHERKGFGTSFGADFFPSFAAGGSFKVFKGDTLVDSLSLSGSASASIVVDRCVAYVKGLRAAEERERNKFAHIPDDPFAVSGSAVVAPIEPAVPHAWVSPDDYPPSAIRAREEGTTQVKFSVNAQGRVENCVVVVSSGSPALDSATCLSLTRRGRYPPSSPSPQMLIYKWILPEN